MHVFPKVNWWPSGQDYCFSGDFNVLQPLNASDIATQTAAALQHSVIVPGGLGTEQYISNQPASHITAAPKGAGEGWEACSTKTATHIFTERGIYLGPQLEPQARC